MSSPGARRSEPTAAFDVGEPLPNGRLAIEASAGTGKTYALTSLAVRFIAERNVPANELLIVTFTRAATAELRNRVRVRLVEAADHLVKVSEVLEAGGEPNPTNDELLNHLASDHIAERLANLRQAVSEFDSATISTIHGFATQVLATLGSTTAADPDASFVDDQDLLVEESCCDVLAAAAARGAPAPLPKLNTLRDAVRVALRTPDLRLAPTSDDVVRGNQYLAIAELVEQVVATITERRRRAGTVSYDNILVDLRAALRSAPNDAIESIRSRFSVALVDEFQDTDPVQWEILSTLFPPMTSTTALVLVGDPKQAIYSFRGADVATFTQAVRADDTLERALTTNRRSDGALLDALAHLFDGTVFGDGIRFTPVAAAHDHQSSRLTAVDGTPIPPVAVRLALDDQLPRSSRSPYDIPTPNAEQAVYGDLGREVRSLLDDAHIPSSGGTRPVRPADIAVLVRTGREADAVQALLLAQGVPAVLARSGNVLLSPAATQWRWLLEALNRPSDPGRTRTYALSWFGGWDVTRLNSATDLEIARLQEQLQSWADCLRERGVSDLIRRVWSDSGVAAHVLTRADGDRSLTDLDHIGELLQLGGSGLPIGTASVAGLLAALEPGPNLDDLDETIASRRVETESEAVQIMTVWVSKGLEFPIVLCPTLWRQPRARLVITHDHERGERILDLAGGKDWPDAESAAARKELSDRDARAEDLRLLYVALTRARHRVVVWWTRTKGADTTALAHLLFGRSSSPDVDDTALGSTDDSIRPVKVPLPPDDRAALALHHFEERSNGTISVAVHGSATPPSSPWIDPTPTEPAAGLGVAQLANPPDRSSARWSFTAITSRSETRHIDPTDDRLADGGADDEAATGDGPVIEVPDQTSPVDASTPTSGVSPLASLPAGAAFGTMVHAVLEEVDFTDEHLDTALASRIEQQMRWRRLDLTPRLQPTSSGGDPVDDVAAPTDADGRALLTDGLRLAIRTPLGPLFDHRSLSTFGRSDRIDEMSFELGLGEAGVPADDRSIGRLIVRHLEPAHPLVPWARSIANGAFDVGLSGHLTGSIDAVIRVRGADGASRFVVVDYKTNRLTPRDRPARHGDYDEVPMTEAMAHHHYPLQALIYSVALHRFLRSRLPDYSPDLHLGGAAYLFVRGMSGPLGTAAPSDSHASANMVHGVYAWAIPPGLVVDLSRLLHGDLVNPTPGDETP